MNAKTSQNVWLARAGKRSSVHSLFLDKNVVALAHQGFDDLSEIGNDPNLFKARAWDIEHLKQFSNRGPACRVGSVFHRFIYEMSLGDLVLYPSTSVDRKIHFGYVKGHYCFDAEEKDYPHQRNVDWFGSIPRDDIRGLALKETSYFFQFYRLKKTPDFFWELALSMGP